MRAMTTGPEKLRQRRLYRHAAISSAWRRTGRGPSPRGSPHDRMASATASGPATMLFLSHSPESTARDCKS